MKFPNDTVHCRITSPLGEIVLAASAKGLSGAWFEGQRHQVAPQNWPLAPQHPVLTRAAAQLTEYFGGQRRAFDVPLDLSAGTPFQQAVWRALLTIATGTTRSYKQVSSEIGQPAAVRAVAGAVGRNPLSIIVPCHRVLGSDGTLTGYAGGLPRKRALLQLEGATFSTDDQQGLL
ncbi:methylated-DNA--[protein]-cysteine S-methyltransferase [Rhodoferax sp.]|uniref:methylated-DNA--[protein]-cysteine S-methyltransferase n=1 Tax=Rhodoferax sp. TaxID=50421 RepID=UPI002768DE88|nr:methylated-DNA--[protein]-cysteine S-methyltransferase [Rhodoferax sp.]